MVGLMISDWSQLLIPIAGLMIHVASQCTFYRLSRITTFRSLVFGFFTGLTSLVVMEYTLAPGSIALWLSNLFIYTSASYGYFNYVHLSETGIRFRILWELERSVQMPESVLLSQYNAEGMIDSRIDRLLGSQEMVSRNGIYFQGKKKMIYVAKIFGAFRWLAYSKLPVPFRRANDLLMENTERRILGVWDLSLAPHKLGALLIFLEELALWAREKKASEIDIAIVCGAESTNRDFFSAVTGFLPNLSRLHFLETRDAWKAFLAKVPKETFIWPRDNPKNSSLSESTLWVQKKFVKTGSLVFLKEPQGETIPAMAWLSKYVPHDLPVVCHLKNNPKDSLSNAKTAEWLRFFQLKAIRELPIHFVLIGNDPLDPSLTQLPNVTATQLTGGNIGLDLSLVLRAFIFMGMSSGPCQVALFSCVPYLIWKHPGHHTLEMQREFGDWGHFAFASDCQKFMQDWDTAENLAQAFFGLYEAISPRALKGQAVASK